MLYRKSIFEKNGKFKFVLLEQQPDRDPRLCESAESSSALDMSVTTIEVFWSRIRKPTEQDYLAQRDQLERDGWMFRVEQLDELPIAIQL